MPGTITGRAEEPKPISEKILEPSTNAENLIDLDAYNANRSKELARQVISEQKQSRFKCPRCFEKDGKNTQLFYDNPDMILAVRPPQKKLICKACNYVGYVLA